MWEEKSPFEKKIQIPERFPHPDRYLWGISYEYLPGWPEPTKEEIIRLCLCHTIFISLLIYYLLLLTVNITSYGLVSALNPLTTNVPRHIETSQLICIGNQLTGSCMTENTGRSWVNSIVSLQDLLQDLKSSL